MYTLNTIGMGGRGSTSYNHWKEVQAHWLYSPAVSEGINVLSHSIVLCTLDSMQDIVQNSKGANNL